MAAGYQSMGMGLFEKEYITPDYAPTIVACGEEEREIISQKGHPAFVKRLEELDVNHVNLFMQGLGHHVPYGFDERLGVDRYQLVHDFFDRYLKVEEKLPPVVLIVSPRDNQEEVPTDTEISIQFAPVIDERSIIQDKGVLVVRAAGNGEIPGIWSVSHGGTKFHFRPDTVLEESGRYRIVVTKEVRDKAGTHLEQEKTTLFTAAGASRMKDFPTVKIDALEWMVENLDVGTFRNGDLVPEARTDEEWIRAGNEGRPAFCYYLNEDENGPDYGRLYNWYASLTHAAWPPRAGTWPATLSGGRPLISSEGRTPRARR